MSTAHERVRVALVGVHGYGAIHLENIRRLVHAGRIEFVGAADSAPPQPESFAHSTDVYPSLDEMLAGTPAVDIVILATPIHTHESLAKTVLHAGAHVYVEKPPVASLDAYEELLDASVRAGRAVQVGFQSLGSLALPALADSLTSGEIGSVRGISATGLWTRDDSYFTRSKWAGKRVLDGIDVVDGAVTNPFAHAVQTSLWVAGMTAADDVSSVTTDLYRAHDIDSDDTSVVRVEGTGQTITCAFTLCAESPQDPYVTVHGTAGTADLHYTRDRLTIRVNGTEESVRTFGRDDLLENLIDHVEGSAPLLSPLRSAGAFMRVLEAVRVAPEPTVIGAEHTRRTADGQLVLDGVDDVVRRAAGAGVTFSELGSAWAVRPSDETAVSESPSIRRRSGEALPLALSPRPYLHPVMTDDGRIVTDNLPADHPWHCGVGVAIQDVDGVNFWGGRTYRRGDGYVWRRDHGRVVTRRSRRGEATLDEELSWLAPAADGQCERELLRENRRWTWGRLETGGWRLGLTFELQPGADADAAGVRLGSPGSNGRTGGGYGGFFWRFAPCTEIDVRTDTSRGAADLHGEIAPALTWTGLFSGGRATVVFRSDDGDPWFVRTDGYPGVGLSLAWAEPVAVTASSPVTRTVTIDLVDDVDDVARSGEG